MFRNYILESVPKRQYIEKTFKGSVEEYKKTLENTKTIYVTRLPGQMTEERLWCLFSVCGEIKRIIMGIDDEYRLFAGFVFVEFETQKSLVLSIKLFQNFELDGMSISIDRDIGFSKGREIKRIFKYRKSQGPNPAVEEEEVHKRRQH